MITKEQAEEKHKDLYRYNAFYNLLLKDSIGNPIKAFRVSGTNVTNEGFAILCRIGCCKRVVINNENAHEWSVTQPE